MSLAKISCSPPSQTISSDVGRDISVDGVCSFPTGGCKSVEIGGDTLYSWAPTPIVGKYVNALDMTKEVKISATFRGFDNMISEEGSATRTFTQQIKCIPSNVTGNVTTGDTETQLFNITVNMAKSSPYAAALQPPSSIPVGCLVEDVETRVLAKFEAPNASVAYRGLTAAWKMGDAIPWVSSGPLSATQTTPNSQAKWDGGSQPILQSLNIGSDDHSLELVLKPPANSATLRGSSDVSWKVCIVPGDGYNYYAELCTETFPVRKSQAECDMYSTPQPTSDSAPLRRPSGLQLALFVTWLFASMLQAK